METTPLDEGPAVHHPSLEFDRLLDSLREERLHTQATLLLFTGASSPVLRAAAEEFASELGRPLQHIELHAIADRYIGETEKNLREAMARAVSDDAVLYFDEADALFGKRGDVRDAHDRYANLELTQVLETVSKFPGVVIALVQSPVDTKKRWPHGKRVIVKFSPH
jgi:SpoVK/Ycf46/Vps4 family AAA+-type ATPase